MKSEVVDPVTLEVIWNRLLSVALFCWTLWLGARLGHSVAGVFNRRADAVIIGVLRGWRDALAPKMVSKDTRGG